MVGAESMGKMALLGGKCTVSFQPHLQRTVTTLSVIWKSECLLYDIDDKKVHWHGVLRAGSQY